MPGRGAQGLSLKLLGRESDFCEWDVILDMEDCSKGSENPSESGDAEDRQTDRLVRQCFVYWRLPIAPIPLSHDSE